MSHADIFSIPFVRLFVLIGMIFPLVHLFSFFRFIEGLERTKMGTEGPKRDGEGTRKTKGTGWGQDSEGTGHGRHLPGGGAVTKV